MTELQKLALDALDQLGAMTFCELRTACLVQSKSGLRSSLRPLFKHGLVACDEWQIRITPAGVRAIEANNIEMDGQ